MLHDGECTCDDALCTFYTCADSGLFLRDATNKSYFSTSASEPIRGDWGASSLSIVHLEAMPNPGDTPVVGGGAYSAGDTITLTFSNDTNYGRGPPGCFELYELWPGQTYPASLSEPCRDNSRHLTKADLDYMFAFSHSLGTEYTGFWRTRRHLVITVVNPLGAHPPAIDSPGSDYFTVRALARGNLRGFPAAEYPCEALSPPLQGGEASMPCARGLMVLNACPYARVRESGDPAPSGSCRRRVRAL